MRIVSILIMIVVALVSAPAQTLKQQVSSAVTSANKNCPLRISKDITLELVSVSDMTISMAYTFSKYQKQILSMEASTIRQMALDMVLADADMASLVSQLASVGYSYRIEFSCIGKKRVIDVSPEDVASAKSKRDVSVSEKALKSAVANAKAMVPVDISEKMTLRALLLTDKSLTCNVDASADVAGTEDIFAEQSLVGDGIKKKIYSLCSKDDALRMLVGYCQSTGRSFILKMKEKGTKRTFTVTI